MLKSALKKLPPIAALIAQRDALKADRDALKADRDALLKAAGFVPPGHFYSPIVSIEEAKSDERRIFADWPRKLAGLDLNEERQLELLAKFEEFYPAIDFPENKSNTHRYYYENPSYSYSDAIMLHCMMRYLRPRRVIEIGSGYSSCAMLDTSEQWLGASVAFTFIEPYPNLLNSLVRPDDLDAVSIFAARLQDVPIEVFLDLDQNDILFIDSTHVSKTGSDVNFALFEILPVLKSGVCIHIHDIFYPFEYPSDWVFAGRSWNEIYALRAFLQFNKAFPIVFMNTFLAHFHKERLASRMPLCMKNTGGSIWLRKR
jgi:predicted O-methyltransferase YrrM